MRRHPDANFTVFHTCNPTHAMVVFYILYGYIMYISGYRITYYYIIIVGDALL